MKMYIVLGTAPLGKDRIMAITTGHPDYLIAWTDVKTNLQDLSNQLITKRNEHEHGTESRQSAGLP